MCLSLETVEEQEEAECDFLKIQVDEESQAFLKVELAELAKDLDKEVFSASPAVYVESSIIEVSAALVQKIKEQAPY